MAKAAVRSDALATAKADTTTPALFGSHLVQLGAFSSEEAAHRAWATFQHNPALRNYSNVTTPVTVNGRQLWRVQAVGFSGRASAATLCGSIKAHGGVCFVLAAPGTSTPQGHPVDARFARNR